MLLSRIIPNPVLSLSSARWRWWGWDKRKKKDLLFGVLMININKVCWWICGWCERLSSLDWYHNIHVNCWTIDWLYYCVNLHTGGCSGQDKMIYIWRVKSKLESASGLQLRYSGFTQNKVTCAKHECIWCLLHGVVGPRLQWLHCQEDFFKLCDKGQVPRS